ncbi:MAG TPA: hypothetical protein ENN21_08660, partial [Spirochaetes bacterium]|nr:hypothetical protein [Spirochaetota bacterium]
MAGTPSGLNARYWITDSFGLDLSAGIVLKGDFYYSADLLYEFYDLYRAGGWRLRFFTGFGSMGGFRNNDAYRDIRVPVGVSMPFLRYPFCLSAFVAPAWEILPEKKAAIDFGIAARFNFGLSSRIRDREAELKWRIITIKKNYDQVKTKLDKTGKELDGAINELNKTRGDLGSTRGQLDKTIGSLTAAKGELDETRTELSTARQKLDTTIGELESTRGRLGQATREIHSMKKDLDNAKARLDEAHMELARTRKVLDDREAELKNTQAEMDRTRAILKTEIEGKEKAAEEKKLASKQEELNHIIQKYKKERAEWEKQSQEQKKKRLGFQTKCEARRGIINEEGYCDCREHEQWNTDRSACECVKGYRLNA